MSNLVKLCIQKTQGGKKKPPQYLESKWFIAVVSCTKTIEAAKTNGGRSSRAKARSTGSHKRKSADCLCAVPGGWVGGCVPGCAPCPGDRILAQQRRAMWTVSVAGSRASVCTVTHIRPSDTVICRPRRSISIRQQTRAQPPSIPLRDLQDRVGATYPPMQEFQGSPPSASAVGTWCLGAGSCEPMSVFASYCCCVRSFLAAVCPPIPLTGRCLRPVAAILRLAPRRTRPTAAFFSLDCPRSPQYAYHRRDSRRHSTGPSASFRSSATMALLHDAFARLALSAYLSAYATICGVHAQAPRDPFHTTGALFSASASAIFGS